MLGRWISQKTLWLSRLMNEASAPERLAKSQPCTTSARNILLQLYNKIRSGDIIRSTRTHRHVADRNACTAFDAFHRIHEELLCSFTICFVLAWTNAIDGAGVN